MYKAFKQVKKIDELNKKISPTKVNKSVIDEILSRMREGKNKRTLIIPHGGDGQEIIELSDDEHEQIQLILEVMREKKKREEEKNNK